MKYLLMLLMLGFASCTRVEPNVSLVHEKVEGTVYQTPEGYKFSAFQFTYKNHSYIMFYRGVGEFLNVVGTIHNPDCQCHKKEQW